MADSPANAIPFADLRLGDVVWLCEHPNGSGYGPKEVADWTARFDAVAGPLGVLP